MNLFVDKPHKIGEVKASVSTASQHSGASNFVWAYESSGALLVYSYSTTTAAFWHLYHTTKQVNRIDIDSELSLLSYPTQSCTLY